jgi:hypothetical protein
MNWLKKFINFFSYMNRFSTNEESERRHLISHRPTRTYTDVFFLLPERLCSGKNVNRCAINYYLNYLEIFSFSIWRGLSLVTVELLLSRASGMTVFCLAGLPRHSFSDGGSPGKK